MFSLTTASSSAIRASSLRATAYAAARHNSTRFYSSTMHDNDPEVLEKEKQRNLTRPYDKTSSLHDHALGWNETLASASEAFVKADKSSGSASDMQSKTVEYMRTRRSESDGESSTTANYMRDEVSGPLSSASGKEEVITERRETVVDKQRPNAVHQEVREETTRTASEENVKADRGEI